MNNLTKEKDVCPVWEKYTLSIKEAALYFGLGEAKLRQLCEVRKDIALRVGTHIRIKRKNLERLLDNTDDV